jgi:feruloyl esterase
MQGGNGSIGFALALGLAAASGTTHAALSCAQLTSVTPEAATITSAAVTPAGAVPGAGVSTSVTFCRAQGVARPSQDSEIKFEVWLPATAAAWSGRMKVNGTGGYAGATPYPRLAQDVGDGFVTAGSNMGHDGGESAAWTLNHPEKVKDWGLRAHFYVATAAKTLSQAFYDRPVAHSYFEGCSNGGRQAMMMAQNYPQLFDGIVAGAPSQFYPDVLFWLMYTGKTLQPARGTLAISTEKRNLITSRVLAACDANDGLADGQITNPRACRFNIDTLGPSGENLLTAQELATVKAMYAGTTNERTGEQRYTGAKLGSEANFDPNFADNGRYGPFVGHYVYSEEWTVEPTPGFPTWREKINFSDVYDHTKAFISPVTAAPSPDIAAFTKRGGKLIQFAGWNDSVVPPDGSLAYFFALTQMERFRHQKNGDRDDDDNGRHKGKGKDRDDDDKDHGKHKGHDKSIDKQIEKLDAEDVVEAAEEFGNRVRRYHRLFMLPAVSHCGGGTGPDSIGGGAPEPTAALRDADHHVVSAVIKWVEQGVAPEKIIATKFSGTTITRQRPVCPFPAQAVYKGGDINAASSFKCESRELKKRDINDGDILLIQNSLRQRDLKLPNR